MSTMKKLLALSAIAALACNTAAVAVRNPNDLIRPYKRAPLQDIVTWDADTLMVRGERIAFYSGEFHPYRLPVPGLWLDVFQKIKAMGYNGVSFYVDWALLEGERGVFLANGIFDLQPFFDAATHAGIYLLARPGPYINAESAGGGFPGWMQGINGQLRYNDTAFEEAQALYVKSIGQMIAKGQITNGGPVIMLQVENEYSAGTPKVIFPSPEYINNLQQRFRDAGIVVPLSNNEAWTSGVLAPGTPGAVQLYGYDSYPGGFNCFAPYSWAGASLPTYFWGTHLQQSPTTPNMIPEFQGGAIDGWGGAGYDGCASLTGAEFERIFYKNNIAQRITIMNFYMTYGGTNWGIAIKLGFEGVYTSYDYGSAIKEDRTVTRQKYAEAKLIANFVAAVPEWLTTTPSYITNTSFVSNGAVSVTPMIGTNYPTNFYVAVHTAFDSNNTVHYKLTVPTSKGTLTIPRRGGQLSLIGRDSKIHVTDLNINGHNLLYSSADIFTWGNTSTKTVLVVYGDVSETHELAFTGTPEVEVLQGNGIDVTAVKGSTVLNWKITGPRSVVRVGVNGPFVYFVTRQDAYNMWVLPISYPYGSTGHPPTKLIASGGYLLRNATVEGNILTLTGDLNVTTPFEVILGAPNKLKVLTFNGQSIPFSQDKYGTVSATLTYTAPSVFIPELGDLPWKYHDSLPELQNSYDDSLWTSANKTYTSDIDFNLTTPTSLFGSDYGYNTANVLYRGHFTATGYESDLYLYAMGGSAYAHAAWLNSTFLGSWIGNAGYGSYNSTLTLPQLISGANYVITVVVDNMGYDENWGSGDNGMKSPRGLMDYELTGRPKSAITWKITGNLGGTHYLDKARGPLNEGGMYAERQGWHLPKPPTSSWPTSTPTQGIGAAGIGFYSTSFGLNIPAGYDTPMSFVFPEHTDSTNYRVQLYVNGYQFGKYVSNIGPQTVYPVPEGILNHHGMNYVAMTLWALDASGASIPSLSLQANALIQSGYGAVPLSPMPAYSKRAGAY